ncbi:MAG: hypothetical protein COB51_00155 [Moraxellaceae bacterium]|nr:MAG: hypothetical protein COB51_00155 [Moraxellaceae bacterium]
MKILIAFLVVALQKNNKPVGHEYCRTLVNQWYFVRATDARFSSNSLLSFLFLVMAPVFFVSMIRAISEGFWAFLLSFLLGFLVLMMGLTLHKLRRRMFRYRRAWIDHNENEMKDLAFNDWQVDRTLTSYNLHNQVIDRMLICAFKQAFVYLFWYWFIGVEGLLFYFLSQAWLAAANQFDDQFEDKPANRWVNYLMMGIHLVNNLAARLLAMSFLFSGNALRGMKGIVTDSVLNLTVTTTTLVVRSARSTLSLDYLVDNGADNTLLGKQQIIVIRKLISRTLGVWFIGFALLAILVP